MPDDARERDAQPALRLSSSAGANYVAYLGVTILCAAAVFAAVHGFGGSIEKKFDCARKEVEALGKAAAEGCPETAVPTAPPPGASTRPAAPKAALHTTFEGPTAFLVHGEPGAVAPVFNHDTKEYWENNPEEAKKHPEEAAKTGYVPPPDDQADPAPAPTPGPEGAPGPAQEGTAAAPGVEPPATAPATPTPAAEPEPEQPCLRYQRPGARADCPGGYQFWSDVRGTRCLGVCATGLPRADQCILQECPVGYDRAGSECLSPALGMSGKATKPRGAGTIPINLLTGECPPGKEYQNGLCYWPCPPGYDARGPVCWEKCPWGWIDDALPHGSSCVPGHGSVAPKEHATPRPTTAPICKDPSMTLEGGNCLGPCADNFIGLDGYCVALSCF